MAIPDYARRNFQTLLRAAKAGHLALMECKDSRTGEIRYIIYAFERQDEDYRFTPFGDLADDHSFEMYVPINSTTREKDDIITNVKVQ